MKKYLLVFMLLVLPACLLSDDADTPTITLFNQTAEPIYYFAVDAETATLIDIIPNFDPANPPFPILQPTQSRSVEQVDGYKAGDDIVFFIYAVRDVLIEGVKTERGTLVRTMDVSAEALTRNSGRVLIDSLRDS